MLQVDFVETVVIEMVEKLTNLQDVISQSIKKNFIDFLFVMSYV